MSRVLGQLLRAASHQYDYVTAWQFATAGFDPDQVSRKPTSEVVGARFAAARQGVRDAPRRVAVTRRGVVVAHRDGLVGGPNAVSRWDPAEVSRRRIDLVVEPGGRIRRRGGFRSVHPERIRAIERVEVRGPRGGAARELLYEETAPALRQRRRHQGTARTAARR